MDHMNSARQHHDHAYKNGDRYVGLSLSDSFSSRRGDPRLIPFFPTFFLRSRSSLCEALHLYSLAYALLPGNTSLKKRFVLSFRLLPPRRRSN